MNNIRVVVTTTRKNGEIIAHEYDDRTRSWSIGEHRSDQIDAMKLYITRATK